MSRVLVANPPTYVGPGHFFRPVRFPAYHYATPVMHPPLYLLGAATALRDHGAHEVSFVDAQAPGLTVPAFLDRVAALRPEVAVLETCLPSFANDRRVAGELRERTGCRVVLVGPHLVPEVALEILRHREVDAAILGEYEASLLELLDVGLAPGVPGTAARDASGAAMLGPPRPPIADLDALPDPDQRWLDHRAYYDPLLRNPFAFFLAGRGCPYRCVFCSWPQTFTGRRYRPRSPARVADEVARTLAATPHVRSFLFNDDTFTADREHALGVCAALAERRIRVPWGCYTRADFDDDAVLRALRAAGCRLLKVGVESADPGIQRAARKGYDLRRAERAINRMKSHGFHVHATFALGLPGETPETLRATVDWACRVGPRTVQFSVAVPYPGTAFHGWLAERGFLRTHAWEDLGPLAPVYEYPELPRDALARAIPAAYRRFYLRPSQVGRVLCRLAREPRFLPRLASRFVSLLSARAAPRRSAT